MVNALSRGNVFDRTRALSEGAISPDVTTRLDTADALATGAGNLGALSAVQHLARDVDEDVRAAAVSAAAVRLERAPGSYGAVVRTACSDEARVVRRVAIAALRKAVELGHTSGAAPALVRCAVIDDRVTQALAIDALGELAAVKPRRALDALAELARDRQRLDPSVLPELRARIEDQRASQPRRVRRLLAELAS